MEIYTFTSFPFKIRNFPLKRQFEFFFLWQFFLSSFHSEMQQLAPKWWCPGQPSKSLWAKGEICHPVRRLETERNQLHKREKKQSWKSQPPPQDVRAGTNWWLAAGEPHRFALDFGLVWQVCHWNWDFSMFWQICMFYSNKSYQNIPSHLQERLSETLKRFWGGGKMGRWVRRCEGLAVEAAQDRGKLEKHKYGKGEKGGEPVETWEDSRRATLQERVCWLR